MAGPITAFGPFHGLMTPKNAAIVLVTAPSPVPCHEKAGSCPRRRSDAIARGSAFENPASGATIK